MVNRVRSVGRPVAALAIVTLVAACTAYRPLTRQPLPRDDVRLTFLSPRDVSGQTDAGRIITLRRVTELRGSIASIAPDTVRLFVASARGPDGDVGGVPSGLMVAVARDWYPTMQERHTSMTPVKTLGLVALAALALLVLGIGLALEEM
jgi:hypothetical protein